MYRLRNKLCCRGRIDEIAKLTLQQKSMQREVHGYDMIDFFSLEAERPSLESAFSR